MEQVWRSGVHDDTINSAPQQLREVRLQFKGLTAQRGRWRRRVEQAQVHVAVWSGFAATEATKEVHRVNVLASVPGARHCVAERGVSGEDAMGSGADLVTGQRRGCHAFKIG